MEYTSAIKTKSFVSWLTYGLFIILSTFTFQTKAQYCPAPFGDCGDSIATLTIGTYSVGVAGDCFGNSGYYDLLIDTVPVINTTPTTLTIISSVYSDTDGFIWIDWNENDSWDTTEVVPCISNQQGTATGVILVPTGTALGIKRMRIIIGTDAFGPFFPCSGSINPLLGAQFATYDLNIRLTDVLVPSTGTAAYCAATGNCGDTGQYAITNVTLAGDVAPGINNTTVCDNYGDYTNQKATVTGGTPYTVTFEGGNNLLGVGAVFVDWNNDGDFGDPGESFNAVNPGPFTAAMVPPITEASGAKRMRIRTTSLVNTPAACGNQANGEVEDYTLIYINPLDTIPGCVDKTKVIPSNGKMNVCQRTTIAWPKATDATNYKFSLWTGSSYIESDRATTDTFYVVVDTLTRGAIYNWIAVPYTAGGTAGIACDTLTFAVSPNGDPISTINPTLDSICLGSTLVLDGNPSGGTTPYTHAWTGSNMPALSSATVQSPTFTGSALGQSTYLYTVTDANGCKGTGRDTVQVKPNAVAGTTSATPNTICAGSTSTLQVTGNTGTITWESAPTKTGPWSTATLTAVSATKFTTPALTDTTFFRAVVTLGMCSVFGDTVAVNVKPQPTKPTVAVDQSVLCQGDIATLRTTNYGDTDDITWTGGTHNDTLKTGVAGDYSATVTVNGCTNTSAAINITVNPRPAKPGISRAGNNPACDNEVVTFTSSVTGGNTWNTGATTDAIIITASGSYWVTQTNGFGCSANSDTLTQTINPSPAKPTITVGSAMPYCQGQSIQLISSSATGNTWNTGSTNDTTVVTTDGNYFVTVTAAGCSSTSDDTTITFEAKPATPTITPNPTALCVGTPTTLTSNYTGGNHWSTSATTDAITITTNGTYKLSNTNAAGCISDTATFVATFGAVPVQPTFVQSGDTLKATGTGASYQWYDSTGAISGATAANYKPTHSGYYYVVTISAGGCASASSVSKYFSGTGILSTKDNKISFEILPNPNSGSFKINIDQQSATHINILDLSGRVVGQSTINGNQTEINTTLSVGTYLIQVMNKTERLATERMVIQ